MPVPYFRTLTICAAFFLMAFLLPKKFIIKSRFLGVFLFCQCRLYPTKIIATVIGITGPWDQYLAPKWCLIFKTAWRHQKWSDLAENLHTYSFGQYTRAMPFIYGKCSFFGLGDRFNVCRVYPTMANAKKKRVSGKPDNGNWSGILRQRNWLFACRVKPTMANRSEMSMSGIPDNSTERV